MTSIRVVIAALGLAAGVALSAQARAQSAPMPYALQGSPEIPSITTKQQQDEVMSLLTAHLGLWREIDPDRYPYEELVTEDAVFEYPYSEDEAVRRIEGRKAVADTLRKLAAAATGWTFGEMKLFETPSSNIFFIQYTATAQAPMTQHTYEQRYLTRITVRDGKIANYYELWDRSTQAAAFSTAARQ